jgi:hypothetical protein
MAFISLYESFVLFMDDAVHCFTLVAGSCTRQHTLGMPGATVVDLGEDW